MMEYIQVIISAVMLGVVLSLILIGPVFFLLIETSLTKGIKAALALDMGVIAADLVFIGISYYGSKEVAAYLALHPETFAIRKLVILVFGLFQIIAKGNLHFKGKVDVGTNYISTFARGFMLNFVNLGILVFWLATVIIVNTRYHHEHEKVFLFFIVVLGTFLAIDLLKIFLARKFKDSFTDEMIYKMKKGIGAFMMILGIYLIVKSFGSVNIQDAIDKNPLQKIENQK